MKNLVSIALTTWNGERFLKQQLDSILNQSYRNIEIIIVDDCSHDGTKDIIEEYSYEEKIKFISNNENIGCNLNFMRALEYCRGEYICFADQDDIWESNKVELMIKNIDENDLIYTNGILIDGEGKELNISLSSFVQDFEMNNKEEIFKTLCFDCFITGNTLMFSRRILEKSLKIAESTNVLKLMSGFKNKVAHDWLVVILSYCNYGIKYINHKTIKYRIHDLNHSMNYTYDGKPIIGKKSLFQKISYFFSKDFNERIRIEDFNKKNKLKFIFEQSLYKNEKDQFFVEEALEVYKNPNKRFKFLLFSIKNHKYIYSGKKIYQKIIFITYRFICNMS